MGIFDGLLGQLGGEPDVVNLAKKIGLDPAQVENAIGALAKSHTEAGDTAEGAAAATGLPLGKIQEIIGHVGGEGSLAYYADLLQKDGGILSGLDKDGDGSPLDDIAGLASGLFGKK